MALMENDKPDTLLSHYATKEDFQGVRVELQALRGDVQLLFAELKSLRTEMQLQVQLMRSDFDAQIKEQQREMQLLRSDLQGQMHELARNMERAMHAQTWKMVGLVLAVNAATVTAVYYIANG